VEVAAPQQVLIKLLLVAVEAMVELEAQLIIITQQKHLGTQVLRVELQYMDQVVRVDQAVLLILRVDQAVRLRLMVLAAEVAEAREAELEHFRLNLEEQVVRDLSA
jgi:hypothetical protein